MRVELAVLPAIHLGAECVIPQRRTWDVIGTGEELRALGRAAEALANHSDRFPLDAEAARALAFAIETVQLVVRREEEG
ncbi:MAG: hypothetical protein EXR91_13135 [Gemmatimonadetes bacterium]|nr:hypothetical protein [Gemmatimonadota bacterium]